MGKPKQVPEFYCPNGCREEIDEEKSNENWQVQSAVCPTCGERLLFRIIDASQQEQRG